MWNRRRKIPEETVSRSKQLTILDQLEREVRLVLDELMQSREETTRLRTRVKRLEEALEKRQGDDELKRLEGENRELREKMERITIKAREVLKKLEVIEEG